MAGSAIAFGGMIGFVGLIIPHIARILAGNNYKYITIASMFLGFTLMIISDTIGRVILPNSEVPVSIILSFIGVPFFIFFVKEEGLMLLRTRNLTLKYKNKIIVNDLNINFPIGKITTLCGLNGAGKSTILKALSNNLKPLNTYIRLSIKLWNSPNWITRI